MKIRSNSYELTKLTKLNGNYDKVAEALREQAMVHSIVGDREQFYMLGGKVTLQLRRTPERTFLDVTRTSLMEPRYVKRIIEQLGGRWSGSYESPVNLDKSIELLVK